MANIVIMASKRGTNMEAVVTACKNTIIKGNVVAVISNNKDAEVLGRARRLGIKPITIDPNNDMELNDTLRTLKADLVVLAGYLKKIKPSTVREFENKIINIHPSLLPKYGGEGMYGPAVHEAVMANHETHTGVTIHYVNEQYDEGDVIDQLSIPIYEDDNVDTLSERIRPYEHMLLVHTISRLLSN